MGGSWLPCIKVSLQTVSHRPFCERCLGRFTALHKLFFRTWPTLRMCLSRRGRGVVTKRLGGGHWRLAKRWGLVVLGGGGRRVGYPSPARPGAHSLKRQSESITRRRQVPHAFGGAEAAGVPGGGAYPRSPFCGCAVVEGREALRCPPQKRWASVYQCLWTRSGGHRVTGHRCVSRLGPPTNGRWRPSHVTKTPSETPVAPLQPPVWSRVTCHVGGVGWDDVSTACSTCRSQECGLRPPTAESTIEGLGRVPRGCRGGLVDRVDRSRRVARAVPD